MSDIAQSVERRTSLAEVRGLSLTCVIWSGYRSYPTILIRGLTLGLVVSLIAHVIMKMVRPQAT